MSDYFEQVERELRSAVRRQAHLPWLVRLRARHPRTLMVVLVGLLSAGPALAVAGLFHGSTEITSTSCSEGATGGSSRATGSCVFVLSDGRRYSCPATFSRITVSGAALQRSKVCTQLRRLAVSSSTQRLYANIDQARRCLIEHGLRARGGPVLPPQGPNAPDGELITGNGNGGGLVAFYNDIGKADRLAPKVIKNAGRFGGQVERRGTTTIVWIRPPSSTLRHILESCLLGS